MTKDGISHAQKRVMKPKLLLDSGPFLLDDAAVKQKIREQFRFAKGGGTDGKPGSKTVYFE